MSRTFFTSLRSNRVRGRHAALGVVMISLMSSSTVLAPSIALASAPLTPAEKSAQEIQAARDRADAAAQAVFDTESEIDGLEIEIAETEAELVEIEAEADGMRSGLEQQAIRSYVGAGGPTMPLLIDIDASNDALAAEVLSSVATETAYVDLDDFDAVMVEIGETRKDLEEQQDEAAVAAVNFAALIEKAEAEVILLGEIEEQRLKDEAVRLALEAEQRARAEQQRQEQEAEQAQAAREAAAATAAARPAGNSSTPPPAQPVAQAPEAPVAAAQASGSGLACPVAGPRAFADTWGAGRSGGRSHEGVDVISPGGTPLVAMESGRVEYRSNGLGGQTLRLYGGSGTRYYYAHLSRYEGGNRTVNKGDVVGYVGRSGNTTTNHLHLQIHPGGGPAVNPYPATRAACG